MINIDEYKKEQMFDDPMNYDGMSAMDEPMALDDSAYAPLPKGGGQGGFLGGLLKFASEGGFGQTPVNRLSMGGRSPYDERKPSMYEENPYPYPEPFPGEGGENWDYMGLLGRFKGDFNLSDNRDFNIPNVERNMYEDSNPWVGGSSGSNLYSEPNFKYPTEGY